MKVLICNNCKAYYIAPKEKCKCGSTTLTETHPNNLIFSEEFIEGCEMFFGGKKIEKKE